MGRVKSDSDKTTSTLRQQAVDRAWEREVELVREGKGTRQWTPEEQKELLSTGKVEGYQGHHMQSVNTYPENAGNPDNIQFLTHDEHFNGAHNGSYYNQTNGYYDPQTKTMNEFKDNQIEPVQPVELEQSAWSTPEEREEAYKQGLVYRNDRDYDDKLAKYEKGLNERTDLTDEQKAERLSTMKEKYEHRAVHPMNRQAGRQMEHRAVHPMNRQAGRQMEHRAVHPMIHQADRQMIHQADHPEDPEMMKEWDSEQRGLKWKLTRIFCSVLTSDPIWKKMTACEQKHQKK